MFKKYFGDMGFWRIALKLAFPVAMQNLLTSSFILVSWWGSSGIFLFPP